MHENIWTSDIRHSDFFRESFALIWKRKPSADETDKKYDTIEQTEGGEGRPSTNDWFRCRGPLANTWSFSSCRSSFASNFQFGRKKSTGVNKLILSEPALTRAIVFKRFLPHHVSRAGCNPAKNPINSLRLELGAFCPALCNFPRYFERGEYRRFESACGNFRANFLWNERNLRLLICIMYQLIVFVRETYRYKRNQCVRKRWKRIF